MSALRCIAMIAFVIAAVACDGQGPAPPPPPEVDVAPIVERSLAEIDEFTGHVTAPETVELRSRVSGYVATIAYTEGAEVASGDVLFTIDDRTYRAELDRANAELSRARAQAALARTQAARARKLIASRTISADELDERIAQEAGANAAVEAAAAAVATARLNIDYTQVRAPVAGRASSASVTVGNLARADETVLATIVSLDPVYVYFEGDESDYLRYSRRRAEGEIDNPRTARPPVRVGLATEEGFPHEGYLDYIDNAVDARTGTIRARAVVPNADRILIPGLFARVQVAGTRELPTLVVDAKAVLTDQDREYVYVVGADGKAQRRDIELGRTVGGDRVVKRGLVVGERVVVAGMQRIFVPGMPVSAHELAPPVEPKAASQP